MKSLFVLSLISLFSLRLFAFSPAGKILHMESNTDAAHRVGNGNGKSDTYLFININESGNFIIPPNASTCETVFEDYKKAIDFDTLKKLGDEHHIYYTLYQTEVYFDGWNGDTQMCDFNTRGQMITKIVGAIQGADDVGNAELAKYVQAVSKNHFFKYEVQWWKPIQISNRYVLRHLIKGASIPDDLTYFKSMSSQSQTDPEMALFEKAFRSSDNTTELIQFFKDRVEDPSTIEKTFAGYAANKSISQVYFSQWPVFIMSVDDVAISIPELGDERLFNCDAGGCYH